MISLTDLILFENSLLAQTKTLGHLGLSCPGLHPLQFCIILLLLLMKRIFYQFGTVNKDLSGLLDIQLKCKKKMKTVCWYY